MNYIVGEKKPYCLVRMIPPDERWAETHVTMAFPSSVPSKLWLPGEAMPLDLIDWVGVELPQVSVPSAAPAAL